MLIVRLASLPVGRSVSTAKHLRNRTPTSSSPLTPFAKLFGKTPDLSHLRIFGSVAYPHIPKEKRTTKLEPRAAVGRLVGYTLHAYKIYVPSKRTVLESRDCRFDEANVTGIKSAPSSQPSASDSNS
jgi:hypothetical protein